MGKDPGRPLSRLSSLESPAFPNREVSHCWSPKTQPFEVRICQRTSASKTLCVMSFRQGDLHGKGEACFIAYGKAWNLETPAPLMVFASFGSSPSEGSSNLVRLVGASGASRPCRHATSHCHHAAHRVSWRGRRRASARGAPSPQTRARHIAAVSGGCAQHEMDLTDQTAGGRRTSWHIVRMPPSLVQQRTFFRPSSVAVVAMAVVAMTLHVPLPRG